MILIVSCQPQPLESLVWPPRSLLLQQPWQEGGSPLAYLLSFYQDYCRFTFWCYVDWFSGRWFDLLELKKGL